MARRCLTSLVLVALLLALGTGCRRRAQFVTGQAPPPGGEMVTFAPLPTTVVVSGTHTDAEVREALARALESRRYAVETSEPTRVVGRLTARGVSLRIAIDFTPQQVMITYLDSTGVEFEASGTSRRYEGWMRSLVDSIQEEIARPERERQEAIARAEHERQETIARSEEAQRQRERDARDAEARERERDRQERLERDRLAAARAQAEADAASARARAAEAEARPRVQVGTYAVIDRLGFDQQRARRGRGVIQLDAGFVDAPRAGRGRAGGPQSAGSMGFPDACPGWFPGEPQHTVVLTSDVPYLRIETPSDGDATLAIVAPDGSVWCDDDSAGSYTPRIEGWFPAGVYQIYVGNYQRGQSASYELLFSERGAGTYVAAAPAAPPAPDCRQTLIQMGHSPTSLMFCDGAEPQCADTLLRMGHSPTSLQFCQGVEPSCAVTLLQQGHSPTQLMNCR